MRNGKRPARQKLATAKEMLRQVKLLHAQFNDAFDLEHQLERLAALCAKTLDGCKFKVTPWGDVCSHPAEFPSEWKSHQQERARDAADAMLWVRALRERVNEGNAEQAALAAMQVGMAATAAGYRYDEWLSKESIDNLKSWHKDKAVSDHDRIKAIIEACKEKLKASPDIGITAAARALSVKFGKAKGYSESAIRGHIKDLFPQH